MESKPISPVAQHRRRKRNAGLTVTQAWLGPLERAQLERTAERLDLPRETLIQFLIQSSLPQLTGFLHELERERIQAESTGTALELRECEQAFSDLRTIIKETAL